MLKPYIMAYTTYSDLDAITGTTVKHEICTPAEDQAGSPFYVEDIIRLTQQPDFQSIKKYMAKFWGKRWQVWIGHKADGTILEEVIALACPPYYPPYTTVGVLLGKNDSKREEFEKNESDFS